MGRRIINVSVLPGEPTDGSGRVCIHLFVQNPHGPFVEPHVLHPVVVNGEVSRHELEAETDTRTTGVRPETNRRTRNAG